MRAAVSFLTVFGGARPPGPRTFAWFPLVGALMGLALGGVWWVAGRAWPVQVAAAIVVAADLGLTGMLHFDGLVDSADGLLSPLDRDRRLAAMADARVGAFGLAAGAVIILLRWASLSALRPSALLLAGLWCLSRTSMAVIARTQPYVRGEGGLARAFAPPGGGGLPDRPGARQWFPLTAGGVLAAALLLGWRLIAGTASGGAAIMAAGAVALLAHRRIGGYTGDVLGASGLLAETAGLVVAAARW